MDAIEAIRTRRSVRQFDGRPVPTETLEALLRAAMAAPSAGNQRPWDFIVVTDPAVREAIAEVHPYCQMARQAPVVVAVCGNLQRESHAGYWPQDCAAACQNLLLAAHALGLGAVWTGVYPREVRVDAVRALLSAPEHVVPMALIPIGWPAESPAPQDRYEPDRVHRDRW